MRIAISGAHFSGKSTLIASLLKQLPDYISVAEPYHLLEEEGYEFSNPPSLEDFEQQLRWSVAEIKKSPKNTIFDRSPLDFLAYATVMESIHGEDWIEPAPRRNPAPLGAGLGGIIDYSGRNFPPLPLGESPSFQEGVLQMMEEAIQLLDLIIFVPIEKRIPVPSSEDSKLRMNVDEKLHEMILEDSCGILDGLEVLEVTGSLEKRATMVKSFLLGMFK